MKNKPEAKSTFPSQRPEYNGPNVPLTLHPNWNLGISFSYNAKGIDELKFNMKLNGSKQTTNKSGYVGS